MEGELVSVERDDHPPDLGERPESGSPPTDGFCTLLTCEVGQEQPAKRPRVLPDPALVVLELCHQQTRLKLCVELVSDRRYDGSNRSLDLQLLCLVRPVEASVIDGESYGFAGREHRPQELDQRVSSLGLVRIHETMLE